MGCSYSCNMLNIEKEIEIIKKYVKNEKLIKHMIAVSEIMKEIARKLNENEELWAKVGLFHDIDYEISDENTHGLKAEEILKDILPKDAIDAIKAHNEKTNFKCDSKLAKALKAADQISGLIIASALVMPNKKLEEVKVETLKKKFKQKDFARNIKREDILLIEDLGIKLDEFFEISLNALKRISEEILN